MQNHYAMAFTVQRSESILTEQGYKRTLTVRNTDIHRPRISTVTNKEAKGKTESCLTS